MSSAPVRVAGARTAGPLFLAVLFTALTLWSWGKWTDVHIDFGSELYTAWRLAEGDVLHRDLAMRHGPLSPAVNAALFRLFGVSLRTLVVANLVVLAAITALAWRLLARAFDAIAATAACAFFLGVLAFSQYGPIANFNYVTPYQHAQTHGLLLGLGMIAALDASRRGSRGSLAVAGACLGALFLTKVELFLPALAVCAVAASWDVAQGRVRQVVRAAPRFALAAALPVALAFAWLARDLPATDAWRGVLGNWAHLGTALGDPFYRSGAGLDRATDHLARMALAASVVGCAVAASFLLDRMRPGALGRGAAWAWGLVLAGLGLAVPPPAPGATALALPLATLALFAGGAVLAVRRPDLRERYFAPVLLATFALGMLAKLGLQPRFAQYGFALVAPATWLCVAAWVGGVPEGLRAPRHRGDVARATALALCFAVGFGLWRQSDLRVSQRTFAVGEGGDRILAEPPDVTPRPARIEALRAWLAAEAGPRDTLLVLPEGIILNYWLRLRNPSRFGLFLPTEIAAFGESAMRDALAAHPPDWVVLAHRESAEFGVGAFGRDARNGRALLEWVRAHYTPVRQFGPEPFAENGFGAVVLRRNASEGAR